jgi:hypothetical protein
MREQLTEIIIHHRLYKEMDLKLLLKRAYREHPHLEQRELKQTLKEIMNVMLLN